MLRIPIKIMALVVCVFPVVLQGSQAPTAGVPAAETQAAAKSPSMASNAVNPVHPTPASQARAKAIYGRDCVMCHGANGDGKGDMNTDGKRGVPDLRDPASLKGFTDGDIYNIIEVGRADMPKMPRRTVAPNRMRSGTWLSIFGLFRNHRIQQRTLNHSSIRFRAETICRWRGL
jgi:mono/diheme cytochrome c family protein